MKNNSNDDIKIKFKTIQDKLSMHVNNKFIFREDQLRTYKNTIFDKENWSSKNMRRVYFSTCEFYNVNFRSTGFTGSIFKDCIFSVSNLNNTIFDECIFINCVLKDIDLLSTSFCKAKFNQCLFESVNMDACFLTSSALDNVVFKKCYISDAIWEKAKFIKCLFENTKLEKLNFEFTYFKDVHFSNSLVPFASIPFIFGGINYILDINNGIQIKTAHPMYPEGKMPQKDYIDLLPDLLFFYEKTTNYFPIANICLGIGKISEGIIAIKNGLNFWFHIGNYKMMYYLCELANVYNFSIKQRETIYEEIVKYNTRTLKNKDYKLKEYWSDYQVKMRKCLLSPQIISHVTIDFRTSIVETDYMILSEFMQIIETLLIPKQCYYNIKLRHNSPFELLYTIFGDEQTLLNCVASIVSILGVCTQFYDSWVNSKQLKNKNDVSEDVKHTINEKIVPNIVNIHYNFYHCDIKDVKNEDLLQKNYFTKQSIGCEKLDSSGDNQ